MVQTVERNNARETKKEVAIWRIASYVLSAIVLALGGWVWNLENQTKGVQSAHEEQSQMDHRMMMSDLGPADATYDRRFIDAMVPHHQGALIMAQDALEKASRPEIKKLSREILSSQKREIEMMQQWRTSWYGE